jgi:hypothetical protein
MQIYLKVDSVTNGKGVDERLQLKHWC